MSRTLAIIPLALMLLPPNAACAQAQEAVLFNSTQSSARQPASQTQKFTPVEGADLAAKFESARRAGAKTPYWTAYTFDVRPGVAVDPGRGEFHGWMQSNGDTSVFVGTSNGMRVETPDLGVFVLRESSGGAITRMEVYNLRRPREYSGYPVYWAGRASNEESLKYLGGIAESSQRSELQERATLALALHDDARVAGLLKNFARTSRNIKVRQTAVFWLGQTGGETAYLAGMVRDEREHEDLRETAAHAIGASRDQQALAALQQLYETVKNRKARQAVIHAVADNENRDAAYAFLLRVARTDPDREAREQAIHRLGDNWREAALDDLLKIYAAERDKEVRQSVIHALGEIEGARAFGALVEIARTGDHPDLREQAIHQLGEKKTDAAFDELLKIYDGEQNLEIRQRILHAIGEMKSKRAEDKLFEIARNAPHQDLRREALQRLGEMASERSFTLLSNTVSNSDEKTEVQVEAVRAISEKPVEQSVPLLIKVAKTHPNAEVRKEAIRHLGDSGDPRAVEFFRELLSK